MHPSPFSFESFESSVMLEFERRVTRDVDSRTPSAVDCTAAIRTVEDKWLLASALQKLVRRGCAEHATTVALALARIDSDYLWRRLRVIALEDVCLGNIDAVAHLIAIAGKRGWQRSVGEARLIALVVQSIADGAKDRTACDLISLVSYSMPAIRFRQRLLERPTEWTAMALLPTRPIWQRAVALQLIAGVRVEEHGRLRTLTRAQTRRFRECIVGMELPMIPAYVAARALDTHSLNVALAFAALLAARRLHAIKAPIESDIEHRTIDGFPAAALCQYTRLGRAAIRGMLSNDFALRTSYQKASPDPVGLAGQIIFDIESGLLDNRVEYAPEVRTAGLRAEYGRWGLWSATAIADVTGMMIEREPALHEIRERLWRRQFGPWKHDRD